MSYSNWKLSYYEKEEVIQNKMGHFCDKKWCRYFFHFYFKILKFFIIFFKYLYDIRWKYFNISIFLVLHFLVIRTSFNHILADFAKKTKFCLGYPCRVPFITARKLKKILHTTRECKSVFVFDIFVYNFAGFFLLPC